MYKLFLDLDGVLADFDAGVQAITGHSPEELRPQQMWPRLARADGFYEHLSWMEDGPFLWARCRTLEPTVLTGLPRGTWAEPQKRAWCARELGTEVPVITCMSRDKARHGRAASEDGVIPILVDDRDRIRESWEAMGGVFVHHLSAARSLEELASIYPELQNS